jgi:predicted nuclease of restriction endonuclease-like (RecB) superfamily
MSATDNSRNVSHTGGTKCNCPSANFCGKDPYLFDFLGTDAPRREKELENGLVEHVQKFLLELGQGFAFVGRQVHLELGDQDYYLDLLFYHLKLRRYVVLELKARAFKPSDGIQLACICALWMIYCVTQMINPQLVYCWYVKRIASWLNML